MMVLITYDVSLTSREGARRLRRLAKCCENVGQRVQKSVFECLVEPDQFVKLKAALVKVINPEEDSLRIYYLGSNWNNGVEHIGVSTPFEQEGPIIL